MTVKTELMVGRKNHRLDGADGKVYVLLGDVDVLVISEENDEPTSKIVNDPVYTMVGLLDRDDELWVPHMFFNDEGTQLYVFSRSYDTYDDAITNSIPSSMADRGQLEDLFGPVVDVLFNPNTLEYKRV